MRYADLIIEESMTVREALKRLDDTARKILLVASENRLKGTVTDGDIRRWILKNGDMQSQAVYIMNPMPKFVRESARDQALGILREKMLEAVPVLNDSDEIVDVIFWNDNFEQKRTNDKLETPVVIMAGGKGTRLEPYTKIIPKPLIPIGDQTIVERIIGRFKEYGCNQFYLTVNYKSNMIKAYFNELEDMQYHVHFVDEEEFCGTAGSLSLLKDKLNQSFFVSNCDILIDADYSDILQQHRNSKNKITMITSLKQYVIPYGIVELGESSHVARLVEKPEYDFLVNTGMYILEPDTLVDIPENTFFHITELINLYIERGEKVGVYPVSENAWLDMGQLDELEKMRSRLLSDD